MSASSSKPLIASITAGRYLDGAHCHICLNKECDGLPAMVGEFFVRKSVDATGRRIKLWKEIAKVWEEVEASVSKHLTWMELEVLKLSIYKEFAINRKVQRVNWTRIALQF